VHSTDGKGLQVYLQQLDDFMTIKKKEFTSAANSSDYLMTKLLTMYVEWISLVQWFSRVPTSNSCASLFDTSDHRKINRWDKNKLSSRPIAS
jgi:hypothetical protein